MFGIYFDRFDVCEAAYLYATHYHGGQWSELYKVFGRLHNLGFKPALCTSMGSLEENARAIYDGMVESKWLQ